MYRKINILFALMILTFGFSSCGSKPVKYVEGYVDVIDGDSTTESLVHIQDDDGGQQAMVAETSTDSQMDWNSEDKIPVYVCGAVNNPGVYYLHSSALKKDALDMAGGFKADASTDYINLAETVISGEKIYFPYIHELQDGYNMKDEAGQAGQDGSNRLVNINTATKDELMTLPGIGESKAEDIIKYRDKNGPFQNIQDITKIPGIKEGVYNNLKEHIVVN